MELWLTLVALQAWASAVRLPEGSALFGPPWRRERHSCVRGLQWLSPWPSTLGIAAMRMPLHVSSDGHSLVAHVDLSRSGSPLDPSPRVLDCGAVATDGISFEEHGSSLRACGRPFLHCASTTQARVWHFVASSLAATPAHERDAAWRDHVTRSLDIARLAPRLEEARARTRWLGWTCDTLFVLVFVAVPAIGLARGAEAALALMWPVLLSVAVLAWGLAARAHHGLFPDRHRERIGQLLVAAVYLPALLRLPSALVDAFTAGAHPLAWSGLVDDSERAGRMWDHEIARLEHQARLEPQQAHWLHAMCNLIREARPSILAPPADRIAHDPEAESFCPVCLDDFRRGFDRCAACDTPTTRYARVAEPRTRRSTG